MTTKTVAVIEEEKLYDKSTQTFAEILSSIPNVNFSSGASKGKYIQIRSFRNNPAHSYATELYTQQETPRTFGITLAYDY